jgi:hypothetical protein
MLAGLKSALDCFERFTTEFIEGGLINTSTEAERRKGNMPAHNCNNEGLLGSWRRFSRESPSSTVDHFTDQVMFHRNETQAFIDDHMNTEADQAFLRQEACRIDESGLEKARREELNTHKLAAVEAKRAKDTEKAEKMRKERERLAAIGIETDRKEVEKMTDPKLKDQLELHRQAGDKEVPIKLKLKLKADRLAALLAAVDQLESCVATPPFVSSA